MALTLSVEWAPGDRQRMISLLDPRRYEWAVRQSINRTAGNVAKAAHAKVAKDMGISKSKLLKRRRRTSASSAKFGSVGRGKRATRRRLEAEVVGFGRPFNATRFEGKPLYGGVGRRQTATYHKSYNRPQVATGTWMLTKKAGNPIVTKSGNSFRGVYGPGVAWVMEQPENLRFLQRFANRRFRQKTG